MLPLGLLPATLASIGMIFHTKARAAQCLSLTFCTGESLPRRFSSRARSRIKRKGKGGEGGYGRYGNGVAGCLQRIERRVFDSKKKLRSPLMRRWCLVSGLVGGCGAGK